LIEFQAIQNATHGKSYVKSRVSHRRAKLALDNHSVDPLKLNLSSDGIARTKETATLPLLRNRAFTAGDPIGGDFAHSSRELMEREFSSTLLSRRKCRCARSIDLAIGVLSILSVTQLVHVIIVTQAELSEEKSRNDANYSRWLSMLDQSSRD